MKGFHTNIEKDTLANSKFRKVLYTAKNLQLVLMSLQPGEDIGVETHKENDQFFRFEEGTGKCFVDSTEYTVKDGDALIVPAGAKHNIINTSKTNELRFYTIYSPPHHLDQLQKDTKQSAMLEKREFSGETTE
ncbi:MAG: hypothetical protein QG570_114 [Patescibacteria group bacterium]|nr:hypothetical protein [Patescibacteria group bacterium]